MSPGAEYVFLFSSGVFTECYRKDEERAQKLLVRVSEAWGKTTCLQLALEAKDMKFVSHGGIQVIPLGPAPGARCLGGHSPDSDDMAVPSNAII